MTYDVENFYMCLFAIYIKSVGGEFFISLYPLLSFSVPMNYSNVSSFIFKISSLCFFSKPY